MHFTDYALYSKFWEWEIDTFAYGISMAIATYPGSLNQLNANNYKYTPTAADLSISNALLKSMHEFVIDGTNTVVPYLTDSSAGMTWLYESDFSGNDLSRKITVDQVNDGAVGNLFQSIYGQSAVSLAVAAKAAAPGYYAYPDSSGN